MERKRLVFHVDVNSAFLSWSSVERLKKDPDAEDLRLIPSAVGGDPKKRTGVVLAKSVSAKKFGVRTGEPLAQAFRKCPQLVVIPPDFRIYNRASAAMMKLLAEYAPVVEKFSIDEAFLDMTGTGRLYPDPLALAYEIKSRIHKELGFTVNIGISENKLLAKMASDFEKPDKVHTLFPEEISGKMWNLPVGNLLYVGHHSVEKLNRMDIQTIGQLAVTPEAVLKNVFGMKQAHQMHNYANGIDDSPVGEEEALNKGYGNSITLPCDLVRAREAYPVLLALADSVGSRLRADGMTASSISVSIKDNTFHTVSHQITLSQGTDVTDVIYKNAVSLFDQLWDRTSPIRLLGLSAGKAVHEDYYQYTLFDEAARQKARSLDKMVDSIRRRYGSDALKRASLLDAEQAKRVGRKHKKEAVPVYFTKYAIWDLDGTLLDSLSMWRTLARRYLELQNIRRIPDDLERIVDDMSLEESADYLKKEFGLSYSREEIVDQFAELVRNLYEKELAFFPETREKVLKLYENGCRMCLLTTTEAACAHAALQRGKIRHCFEAIYTCSDLGMNKRGPEIYQKTCKLMGFEPAETMIYEDADYAVKSARESGCQVTVIKINKI